MPAPPSPAKPLLTLAACFALTACEPAPEPSALFTLDPNAPTPPPTTEAQAKYSIDATTPLLLDLRGAATGDAYALTCAQDELVVGLRGRSDTTVTALGLICARMLENGTFANRDERPMIGAATGDEFFSECPQSEAVIALRGRAATTLDRIGVRCARVRPWVQMGSPGSIEPSFGGSGGVPFTDTCPPGYFLQGVLGYAAGTINGTQSLCVPIVT
ncbi:hypothetical protein [Polyangium sp. 15x6]|uniref:hypothetical protein n=1 Tax=Polyangium sp. 15x6 TaxID=3042687 RepID=UPI00249C08B0|nr:hypothetical protein [Polyangium sp. 15x6]MDI3283167.1 hypothetical protein [Polyangium sp. 15x6]